MKYSVNASVNISIPSIKKINIKANFNWKVIEDEEYEEDYEEEFVEDEEYDEVEEVDLEEILELYKSGKSLNEISEITGRSLEDIAVIMGM